MQRESLHRESMTMPLEGASPVDTDSMSKREREYDIEDLNKGQSTASSPCPGGLGAQPGAPSITLITHDPLRAMTQLICNETEAT